MTQTIAPTREFNKLATTLDQALDELRNECPTDALRTLEKAKLDITRNSDLHKRELHIEFWK